MLLNMKRLLYTVIGVVHEGITLFGDVLLRLPDLVKKVSLHFILIYTFRTNDYSICNNLSCVSLFVRYIVVVKKNGDQYWSGVCRSVISQLKYSLVHMRNSCIW